MVNENIKKVVEPKKRKFTFLSYFFCAAIAGSVASFITCPMDNIKTKLQTQNLTSSCEKFESINKEASNLGSSKNISGNNSLECYFQGIQVVCSTIEDNLLLIQLISVVDGTSLSFLIGQDPLLITPSVTISGIVNNVLKNNIFLCSLNNVDPSGNKSQIINGTGQMSININDAIQAGMIKLLCCNA
jgi:hypothetical protein